MEGFNKTVHVFLYNEYQNFIHDCGNVEEYMANLKSVINAAWIESDEMRIAFMYENTGIVVAKLWSSHYYDTIEEVEDRCIAELHDYAEMLQQNPEVQDLFITLATLPDGKRQHAINALNTLIVSLA